MKKLIISFVLLFTISNEAKDQKKEFTDFNIKRESPFVGGFIRCLETGSTDIPGTEKDKLADEKLELPFSTKLRLLADPNQIAMYSVGEKTLFCSQNKEIVYLFLERLKEYEQVQLCRTGNALKKGIMFVLPYSNDLEQPIKFGIIDKEKKEIEIEGKCVVKEDESLMLPSPCMVLTAKVTNLNVSDVELGYAAIKLLKNGQSAEINSIDRYKIKLTVLEDFDSNSDRELENLFPK